MLNLKVTRATNSATDAWCIKHGPGHTLCRSSTFSGQHLFCEPKLTVPSCRPLYLPSHWKYSYFFGQYILSLNERQGPQFKTVVCLHSGELNNWQHTCLQAGKLTQWPNTRTCNRDMLTEQHLPSLQQDALRCRPMTEIFGTFISAWTGKNHCHQGGLNFPATTITCLSLERNKNTPVLKGIRAVHRQKNTNKCDEVHGKDSALQHLVSINYHGYVGR